MSNKMLTPNLTTAAVSAGFSNGMESLSTKIEALNPEFARANPNTVAALTCRLGDLAGTAKERGDADMMRRCALLADKLRKALDERAVGAMEFK